MTRRGQFTTRVTSEYLRGAGVPTTGVQRRILLFDFGTNSTRIETRHDEAIRRYITPILNQGGFNVWLAGMASRAGASDLNERLSAQRVRRVAERIDFRTDAQFGITTTHFGESQSVTGTENSAYSRAVLVVITDRPPISIPPRQIVRPRSPYYNKFRIAMTFGGEAGIGYLAGGFYNFYIDYDRRSMNAPRSNGQKYRFMGGGFGGGPVDISVSSGIESWNYFELPPGRTALPSQFAGEARMESVGVSAGVGPLDGEHTTFTNLHLSPSFLPGFDIMRFKTNWSVSAGASVITGNFELD